MNQRLKVLFFLWGLILLVAGCTGVNADLVDRGIVSIEYIHSDEKGFLDVNVTQSGTTAMISGFLSLDISSQHGPVPGHMDVTVINSLGEPMLVASTPYRRSHPSEPSTHAHFVTSANMIVPENSTIILRHHSESMDIHLPLSATD